MNNELILGRRSMGGRPTEPAEYALFQKVEPTKADVMGGTVHKDLDGSYYTWKQVTLWQPTPEAAHKAPRMKNGSRG
jgi:hypothetical protein